jgi:indolepyruvate ferredoxin oxidoreductase
MARAFRILARFRFLRGTPFDPFGHTAERRMERQMIRDYEMTIGDILGSFDGANAATVIELARLPLKVRGFGHVKMANAQNAAEERAVLLELFRSGEDPVPQAAE